MCHIIFIMHTRNADTLIRGHLVQLAFSALSLSCTTELFHTGWYGDLVGQNKSLWVLAQKQIPKPWVCYYVKEGNAPELDLCHRHGAINMYDVIDNDRRSGVFPGKYHKQNERGRESVGNGLYPVVGTDLWLVNTEEHASMLAAHGLRARCAV